MKHYVGVKLRSRLTVLDKALRAARKTPGEESLHDLRVAVRRYQQTLRLFADFLEPKRVKQMSTRLHRLMGRAGAVRNLDVTLELLKSTDVDDADLCSKLAATRTELQERLSRNISRWSGNRSIKHWREWLRPTSPAGHTWSREGTAAQNAHRVMPSMLDELFAAGAQAVAAGAPKELHRFRLLGKRFRYSLELFEDVYGPRTETCLRHLRALQDDLGAINDCAAALRLIEGHPIAEGALEKLLQARCQAFMEHWDLYQRQHASWKHWLGGRHGNLRSTPRRSRAA